MHHLGLMPYHAAWQLQEHLAQEIGAGNHPPTLLLLEHPHTYTFGRRGQAEHLLWDESELRQRGITVEWVDRGGDVTYHGPGQLVGYPIIPLDVSGLLDQTHNSQPPQADYVGYVRKLEQTLITALARLGVMSGQIEGMTGIWVQPATLSRRPGFRRSRRHPPAKIASIGVKVDAKGVTRHGFSLNINPDMSYWEGIIACGLAGFPAASLADLVTPLPSREHVSQTIIQAFGKVFDFQMVEMELDTALDNSNTATL